MDRVTGGFCGILLNRLITAGSGGTAPLIGKFYSRPSISASFADEKSSSQSDASSEKVYCYCQKSESDQMIGFDNPHCMVSFLMPSA